ncbi:hypothetical protein F511_38860 [Dorcoceras hygrometricum]|uniref:Uncharacterized protein n=1 Tax=Dorcoceras hygrometricum TaxID=472368 RepID=A0A2Z7D7H1_9LAMI|nr:hypothetical protein F511_38860 [Dorcoceras hygrometricum]
MDRIRRRSSRSTVEVPIPSWNWLEPGLDAIKLRISSLEYQESLATTINKHPTTQLKYFYETNPELIQAPTSSQLEDLISVRRHVTAQRCSIHTDQLALPKAYQLRAGLYQISSHLIWSMINPINYPN